jgi:hypothetical protein
VIPLGQYLANEGDLKTIERRSEPKVSDTHLQRDASASGFHV